MLKNYFQVALKGLWKSKFYSPLNMVGIAIGNFACLLALMWFLPAVLGRGISEYKVSSILAFRSTAASNPESSLRNK
jgi:hypothetical protein